MHLDAQTIDLHDLDRGRRRDIQQISHASFSRRCVVSFAGCLDPSTPYGAASGRVADSPDAEEPIGALHHLGLKFDHREVVLGGDEGEIAGRHERNRGSEIDLLADIVGPFDFDVTDELGLGKPVDGGLAGRRGIEVAEREYARFSPVISSSWILMVAPTWVMAVKSLVLMPSREEKCSFFSTVGV